MAFPQISGSCGNFYEKDIRERVNPVYEEDEELYQSSEAKLSSDCYDDFSRTARMDTIYESYEEFVDSSDERSNEASSTDCTSSARVSADSPTSVLRRSVRAWCDATGLPTTVLIETKERSYRLHKFPLMSRSGYFKRILSETTQVKLGDDFPGGPDFFEIVANFCYDSTTVHIDASSVAVLRCCAEYLEMTEDYGKENLWQKTECFLSQVAFRRWEDTIEVLQQSEKLLPMSEEFLLVSRCIDSLAAAACSKFHNLNRGSLVDIAATSDESRALMVEDILKLPFAFFDRFVMAVRKQGLEERPVSQLIMEYMRRWLFDASLSEENEDTADDMEDARKIRLMESIVRLLPMERFVVPVKILFSLHGLALAWNTSTECRLQLESRIASQLELATIEDVLTSMRICKQMNVWRPHTDSMQQIVSTFMSQQQIVLEGSEMLAERDHLKNSSAYGLLAVSAVAKVWDEYLAEIASSPNLTPRRFSELSGAIPSHIRPTHDQLYKAIHVYFKSHDTLSHSERLAVCKGLNCQKLSQGACMHAVQNELMPLRMIVQAMFMQQLQSRAPANTMDPDHLEFAERMASYHRSDGGQTSKKEEDGLPLGLILQRDAAFREASFLKDDFEATKARLRELEEELFRMKRTMQDVDRSASDSSYCKQTSDKEFSSRGSFIDGKGRKKFSSNCMCQIWGPQANGIRFGQRITKTFQRLGLGSFWKTKPAGENQQRVRNSTSAEPSSGKWQHASECGRQEQQELRSATPLRASSFRKTETESWSSSSAGPRRHTRHHSFS